VEGKNQGIPVGKQGNAGNSHFSENIDMGPNQTLLGLVNPFHGQKLHTPLGKMNQ
jgi:hypothetical protein